MDDSKPAKRIKLVKEPAFPNEEGFWDALRPMVGYLDNHLPLAASCRATRDLVDAFCRQEFQKLCERGDQTFSDRARALVQPQWGDRCLLRAARSIHLRRWSITDNSVSGCVTAASDSDIIVVGTGNDPQGMSVFSLDRASGAVRSSFFVPSDTYSCASGVFGFDGVIVVNESTRIRVFRTESGEVLHDYTKQNGYSLSYAVKHGDHKVLFT